MRIHCTEEGWQHREQSPEDRLYCHVAAAVIGSAVVSAGAGVASSRAASSATRSGANSANAEQARQYDQTRADQAPYREIGEGALGQLGRLYGLPVRTQAQRIAAEPVLIGDTELPAGTTTNAVGNGWFDVLNGGQRVGTLRPGGSNGRFINDSGFDIQGAFAQGAQADQAASQASGATTPDLSVFTASPDYQFNLAEGQRAIDRSLAARGRALSGAGVRAGVRYASGMASNEFGNFYNRLANLAGIGQSATNSTAAAGMNAANNIGTNLVGAGNARASGYLQAGQSINNAAQGATSNLLLNQYLQQRPVM